MMPKPTKRIAIDDDIYQRATSLPDAADKIYRLVDYTRVHAPDDAITMLEPLAVLVGSLERAFTASTLADLKKAVEPAVMTFADVITKLRNDMDYQDWLDSNTAFSAGLSVPKPTRPADWRDTDTAQEILARLRARSKPAGTGHGS